VGNVAYGFRLAGDGVHVETDATEQAVLAVIRRLRDEGMSLRKIATTLNHQAYRTRRGTAWRLESVVRALKSDVLAHPRLRTPPTLPRYPSLKRTETPRRRAAQRWKIQSKQPKPRTGSPHVGGDKGK
jgi:hypothetical protein